MGDGVVVTVVVVAVEKVAIQTQSNNLSVTDTNQINDVEASR